MCLTYQHSFMGWTQAETLGKHPEIWKFMYVPVIACHNLWLRTLYQISFEDLTQYFLLCDFSGLWPSYPTCLLDSFAVYDECGVISALVSIRQRTGVQSQVTESSQWSLLCCVQIEGCRSGQSNAWTAMSTSNGYTIWLGKWNFCNYG